MKTFSCGEIVPDCPAVFTGPGYEDLLRMVADHAREVHGLLSVPPEVTVTVIATRALLICSMSASAGKPQSFQEPLSGVAAIRPFTRPSNKPCWFAER